MAVSSQVTREAKIINFNEARGPDPGIRHRWLDRLQDDPQLPRCSTFAVAYAVARFIDAKAATPKVWASIAKIAARAQVPLSTAKAELKWLHDHGWLTFGAGHFKTKVRVLMMPDASSDVADRAATMNTTTGTPSEELDHGLRCRVGCACGHTLATAKADRRATVDADLPALRCARSRRQSARCQPGHDRRSGVAVACVDADRSEGGNRSRRSRCKTALPAAAP